MKIVQEIVLCAATLLLPAVAAPGDSDSALLLQTHREVLEVHKVRDFNRLPAAEQ